MKNNGRGIIFGDWLFTRHGAGDQYATDGLYLYVKIVPGVYYLIKSRREAIEETVVATIRMAVFILALYVLGVLDQIFTWRGFLGWLCVYFITHFGAKK